jgi:hypothetical protein
MIKDSQPVSPSLQLRGHTLLCLQGFRGAGYSPAFVDNLAQIHKDVNESPDQLITLVDQPDAVCGACPHQASSGCTLTGIGSEQVIQAQDRLVLDLLGLQPGARVSWQEIVTRIGGKMSGDDLPAICGSCQWLSLGYCREGIDRLKEGVSSDGERPVQPIKLTPRVAP